MAGRQVVHSVPLLTTLFITGIHAITNFASADGISTRWPSALLEMLINAREQVVYENDTQRLVCCLRLACVLLTRGCTLSRSCSFPPCILRRGGGWSPACPRLFRQFLNMPRPRYWHHIIVHRFLFQIPNVLHSGKRDHHAWMANMSRTLQGSASSRAAANSTSTTAAEMQRRAVILVRFKAPIMERRWVAISPIFTVTCLCADIGCTSHGRMMSHL